MRIPPPGDRLLDLGTATRSEGADQMIAGVAGGLGRHYGIDPVVLRVLLVCMAIFGGAGIAVYVCAWLLMPRPGQEPTIPLEPRRRGAILMIAGAVASISLLGTSWTGLDYGIPIGLAAVVAVVAVLTSRNDRHRVPATQWRRADPVPAGPVDLTKSTAPSGAGPSYPTGESAALPYAYDWTPPPPRPRRPGPSWTWIMVPIMLIAIGSMIATESAGSPIPDSAYAAVVLGLSASGLLLAAVRGRAAGLIPIGLVAAMALGVSSAVEHWDPVERSFAPTSAAAMQSRYTVNAGQLDVDLSQVAADELRGERVELESNAGEMTVTVPEGVPVEVRLDMSLGEADVFGDVYNGVNLEETVTSPGAGDSARPLVLDVDLNVGEVIVKRDGTSRIGGTR